jgi:hypothetical protein
MDFTFIFNNKERDMEKGGWLMHINSGANYKIKTIKQEWAPISECPPRILN